MDMHRTPRCLLNTSLVTIKLFRFYIYRERMLHVKCHETLCDILIVWHVTLWLCDTLYRSSQEMKPLEDSPLDHLHIDYERSSFLNGSEADPEDFPPPPMIDSRDDPYLDYPDDRTPTPPPSPGVSPFNPPRATTPENGKSPACCIKALLSWHFWIMPIHQFFNWSAFHCQNCPARPVTVNEMHYFRLTLQILHDGSLLKIV